MNKHILRQEAVDMLKKVSDEQKKYTEQKLAEWLINSSFWRKAATVGITVSSGFEWNTRPIIESAWEAGKIVGVPKCIPAKRSMEFLRLDYYHQLERGAHGLLEPNPEETEKLEKEFLELLVVPGLLFDRNGYRIGFGGGYYDRFLNGFPNLTISILNAEQLVDHLPNEPYDIPVQYLVTENGIISTG
ncbi:5-formyltetrahydrofolate cyclo-ligase [Virgibacillus xinjiangensis]|uniref:5-formyltetrahydrofolate cyclo-ligase n=1 Tax=Virgibacillus xinjiangensis TaxID=393090 RepID=A0ABV7CRL8_9BACI